MKCPSCGFMDFKENDTICRGCGETVYNIENGIVSKNVQNNEKCSEYDDLSKKINIVSDTNQNDIQNSNEKFEHRVTKFQLENNDINYKKTVKKKNTFLFIYLLIVIFYFAIFIIFAGSYTIPGIVTQKEVENYLYKKYGKDAIVKIKFDSQSVLELFINGTYEYKYYSNEYPDKTFYVILRKNEQTGETKISEERRRGMDDNCTSYYDDTSLEAERKKQGK